METTIAPTYATFTLGYLESKSHNKIRTFGGGACLRNTFSVETVFYDCFIQCNQDADEISNVFCLLTYRILISVSQWKHYYKQMPFLDVLVSETTPSLIQTPTINQRPTFVSTHILTFCGSSNKRTPQFFRKFSSYFPFNK